MSQIKENLRRGFFFFFAVPVVFLVVISIQIFLDCSSQDISDLNNPELPHSAGALRDTTDKKVEDMTGHTPSCVG